MLRAARANKTKSKTIVTKVVIRDNTKSPIHYIADLKAFKNGTEYEFKPGVNIIVGENGSGKTTLIEIIRKYLVVDFTECFRGDYNCNINALFRTFHNDAMLMAVKPSDSSKAAGLSA